MYSRPFISMNIPEFAIWLLLYCLWQNNYEMKSIKNKISMWISAIAHVKIISHVLIKNNSITSHIPSYRITQGDMQIVRAWINGWVNTSDAGDLRRYRTHYDVIVMILYGVYCKCYEAPQCNIRDRSVSFKATSGMTISFMWYINDCPG